MRLGAAQPGHVHVLAGHAADHVRAGDEDAAVIGQDHDVGERGPVRGPAGGRAQHHGDLRDLAGGPGHGGEHRAHRVQALHALAQPRAAGVPQPDHGGALGEGFLVGGHDRRAPLAAHGAALHPRVAGERDRRHPVDGPGRGDLPARVVRGEQADRARVKQRFEPDLGVPGDERRGCGTVGPGGSGGAALGGARLAGGSRGAASSDRHGMSPCGRRENTGGKRDRRAWGCALGRREGERHVGAAEPEGIVQRGHRGCWCGGPASAARSRCRSRPRRQGRPG